MRQYGLLGFPLSHSFSQAYFKEKFHKEGIKDCSYELFPLEDIKEFRSLLKKNPDLKGLTVTTPHKVSVVDYMDELDETAAKVGAVNTILIGEKLKGFNTDVAGFKESLKPLLLHKKALILGSGGAAKAVRVALQQLNISSLIVSRTPDDGQLSYEGLSPELISTHTLIINATPLGMFPYVETYPQIPYSAAGADHLFYDLTYNPEESRFLFKGKQAGAKAKNGLEMLHLQADYAWETWNSVN